MATSMFVQKVYENQYHPFTYLFASLSTVAGLQNYNFEEDRDDPTTFRNIMFTYCSEFLPRPKLEGFGSALMLVRNMHKRERGCDPWILRSNKARIVMESLYNYFMHNYAYNEMGENEISMTYADELAGVIRVIYRMVLGAINDVREAHLGLNQANIDNYLEIGVPYNNADYLTLTHGPVLALMDPNFIIDDGDYAVAFYDGDLEYENILRIRNTRYGHINNDGNVEVIGSAQSEQHYFDDNLTERININDNVNLMLRIDNEQDGVSEITDCKGNDMIENIDIVENCSDSTLSKKELVNNWDVSEYTGFDLYEEVPKNVYVNEFGHEYTSFTEMNHLLTNIDGKPSHQVGNYVYTLKHLPEVSVLRKCYGGELIKYLPDTTLYVRDDNESSDIPGFPKVISQRTLDNMLIKVYREDFEVTKSALKRTYSEPSLYKCVKFDPDDDVHIRTSTESSSSKGREDPFVTGYTSQVELFGKDYCQEDEFVYSEENISVQENIYKDIHSRNNGMNEYYDTNINNYNMNVSNDWSKNELGSNFSMGQDAEEAIE